MANPSHITSHFAPLCIQFDSCSTSSRLIRQIIDNSTDWSIVSTGTSPTRNWELRIVNWQLPSGKLFEIICSFSTDKKLSKNFKCFDDGDLEATRTFDRRERQQSYRASDRNYIHKIWLVVLFGEFRAGSSLLELMPPTTNRNCLSCKNEWINMCCYWTQIKFVLEFELLSAL